MSHLDPYRHFSLSEPPPPTVATGNLLDARGLCAELAQSIDAALRLDPDPDPDEGPMDTAVAVQLVLDLRREADRLAEYLLAHSVPVPSRPRES